MTSESTAFLSRAADFLPLEQHHIEDPICGLRFLQEIAHQRRQATQDKAARLHAFYDVLMQALCSNEQDIHQQLKKKNYLISPNDIPGAQEGLIQWLAGYALHTKTYESQLDPAEADKTTEKSQPLKQEEETKEQVAKIAKKDAVAPSLQENVLKGGRKSLAESLQMPLIAPSRVKEFDSKYNRIHDPKEEAVALQFHPSREPRRLESLTFDELMFLERHSPSEEGWQDKGACAQTDPEAFFPERGQSTAAAKKICKRCSVKAECLQHAVDNDERFGIWGGLSERDRRKLKKST